MRIKAFLLLMIIFGNSKINNTHPQEEEEEVFSDLSENDVIRLLERKVESWQNKIQNTPKTKVDRSQNLLKVYSLIDQTVTDAFLEIQYICLQEFEIDDCFEMKTQFMEKWENYDWSLKMDDDFVEDDIEITMGVLKNPKVYFFFKQGSNCKLCK